MIIPVILCGGIGSRLWPVSRQSHPKQFLKLDSKYSLFQRTILRINGEKIFGDPIIVCNKNYKFKIAAELEEIGVSPEVIIVESAIRSTCPAISLAAHYIKSNTKYDDNSSMLVLPSDHIIDDNKKFIENVITTYESAKNNLVTFGVTPKKPAIGYGYIKSGSLFSKSIYKVDKFTEKPDESTAKSFIESQEYYWNAGIFLFNVSLYLEELKQYKDEIELHTKNSIKHASKELCFMQICAEDFKKCEEISIDYAILEKTDKALIKPLDLNWYDLGSWNSIYEYQNKDDNNNVIVGDNIIADTSNNCLAYSTNKAKIIMHKVDDLVVILTQDALLIMKQENAEDVKDIYNTIKDIDSDIVEHDSRRYRPWGYYEDLLIAPYYRVKLIYLNPNSQISLQYHNKRAEHWVITKGYAEIRKGEENFILKKDESVYIPTGVLHQIKNTTNTAIEFVEVQVGEYVGEDDIVRVSDPYKREDSL